MEKYKYKYIEFTTRPTQEFGLKDTVARVDVSGMNDVQIGVEFGRLSYKYPENTFLSCLTSTNQEKHEFQKDPENYNNKQIKY